MRWQRCSPSSPETGSVKDVLLVCPAPWDEVQLPACRSRWAGQYNLLVHGRGVEDHVLGFDALSFVDESLARFGTRHLDGVTSSSDYPGCIVAAVLAREFGLPGPAVQAVLTCSHKYYARLAHQRVAPEATPRFALLDLDGILPRVPALAPPLFVKPVKSWFSVFARPIDSLAELEEFVSRNDVRAHVRQFAAPFNALLRRYGRFERDASYLLVEELLTGQQVTVEGFVFQGAVELIGIVDSIMYPGTISFQRFEYPSSLGQEVQGRMVELAARVMRAIGFDHGLFNIEMFYNAETDRVHIIEINPRMCGQFADLMELVNGTNTYEVLLALAVGEKPVVRRGAGRHQVAASFPLRAFADRRVLHVPSAEDIAEVKHRFPVTCVLTPYTAGQQLSDVDTSDGASYRYAVINMGGRDRRSLLQEFTEVERCLDFAFADVAP
jgi:biotin carboxylase